MFEKHKYLIYTLLVISLVLNVFLAVRTRQEISLPKAARECFAKFDRGDLIGQCLTDAGFDLNTLQKK